ncbi:MAG: class B sortase [Oscillospiraceae bacterium]|nr:class B sortase [Oscillospiraceae bacterium]
MLGAKQKPQPKHAKHAAPPADIKKVRKASGGKKTNSKDAAANKVITILATLVLIACLGVLGNQVYQMVEAKKNHDVLKNVRENAKNSTVILPDPGDPVVTTVTAVPDEPSATGGEIVTVQTGPVREPRPIMPAANELLAINPDTVGYVRIPDCVDEPVVKGTDNEYYLTHNFYDKQRQCGTCFADYRNVVGDYERSDNIILYAHNQKDGTMFGMLDNYRWDLRYWEKNPFVYFSSNYSDDTYVIISSFVINTLPEHDDGRELFDYNNYIDFRDSGKYSFETFSKEITARSWFFTGLDFDEDDEYLTLSTCSTEWDDSRHVVVARKLREDETADSVLASANFVLNDNIKWPAIYYKYHGGSYIEPTE